MALAGFLTIKGEEERNQPHHKCCSHYLVSEAIINISSGSRRPCKHASDDPAESAAASNVWCGQVFITVCCQTSERLHFLASQLRGVMYRQEGGTAA